MGITSYIKSKFTKQPTATVSTSQPQQKLPSVRVIDYENKPVVTTKTTGNKVVTTTTRSGGAVIVRGGGSNRGLTGEQQQTQAEQIVEQALKPQTVQVQQPKARTGLTDVISPPTPTSRFMGTVVSTMPVQIGTIRRLKTVEQFKQEHKPLINIGGGIASGTRFILEKGTIMEEKLARGFGREPPKKISINPYEFGMSLFLTPVFTSTGFTQSFQSKEILHQAVPFPKIVSRSNVFQSESGVTATITKTTSTTPARYSLYQSEAEKLLKIPPKVIQIAPARTSFATVRTVGRDNIMGTGIVTTKTESKTMSKAFNVFGSSKQFNLGEILTTEQRATLNKGVFELPKKITVGVPEGTTFAKFQTKIVQVKPTPPLGKSTSLLTGTGAIKQIKPDIFQTKTGFTDILKSGVKTGKVFSAHGIVKTTSVSSPTSQTGIRIIKSTTQSSILKTTQISPDTAVLTKSISKFILPATSSKIILPVVTAQPISKNILTPALTNIFKQKSRVIQDIIPKQSSIQKTSSVISLNYGKITTVITRPIFKQPVTDIPRVRTGIATTTGTITTLTTVTSPKITTTITPPFITPRLPAQPSTPFFPFLFLPKFSFEERYGVRKIKEKKRRPKYTPDYSSLIFGRKGNQLKKTIFSGFESRPIPKGFKWEYGRFKL